MRFANLKSWGRGGRPVGLDLPAVGLRGTAVQLVSGDHHVYSTERTWCFNLQLHSDQRVADVVPSSRCLFGAKRGPHFTFPENHSPSLLDKMQRGSCCAPSRLTAARTRCTLIISRSDYRQLRPSAQTRGWSPVFPPAGIQIEKRGTEVADGGC